MSGLHCQDNVGCFIWSRRVDGTGCVGSEVSLFVGPHGILQLSVVFSPITGVYVTVL